MEFKSLEESSKLTNKSYEELINYIKTLNTKKIDYNTKEYYKKNIKLNNDSRLLRFGLCCYGIQSDCPKHVCPFDTRVDNQSGFLDKYTFDIPDQVDMFGSYEDNIELNNTSRTLLSMVSTKLDNHSKGQFRCMHYCSLYNRISHKFHANNDDVNRIFSIELRTSLVDYAIRKLKDFKIKI